MIIYAAFVTALVMLGAHPVYALDISSITAIIEKIPVKNIPYGWAGITVVVVLLFALIYYLIKYRHSKMDLPPLEKRVPSQQPLKDARAESSYINSRKKVFEDAETEYLVEKLKETKKLTQ